MHEEKVRRASSVYSVRFNPRQIAAVEAKARELDLPVATFIRLATIKATSNPSLAKREIAKIESFLMTSDGLDAE
jgi:hypothetical protein